jgi:hypothetical protein
MAAAALAPQSVLDPQHPYPGLKSFTELDLEFFYGRNAEKNELFRLIKRQALTTCFGASGLGKTSLLNAGVFPLLREAQFFPVATRLDFASAAGSFASQILRRFHDEAARLQVEAEEPRTGETLWEYFHRAHFWDRTNRLLMPVVVLDQFEEIFTLGAGDRRAPDFERELADLVENRIPESLRPRFASADEPPFSADSQHYRVLLSLREDFLPHLEDFQSSIPSLTQNRFRLTAMNGVQAMEAILNPGRELVSREVALDIVRAVAGRAAVHLDDIEQALDRLRIEPTILSLFCHELNNRRVKAALPAITADLVRGAGDQIVLDFYEDSVRDRRPEVRAFIEDHLLTGSGFRRAEAVEEATRLPGVTLDDIKQLEDRRLLRTEERLGIPHVELTHDVLTGVVVQSRNRRRIDEERLRQRARARKRMAIAVVICLTIIGCAVWAVIAARRQAAEAAKDQKVAELAATEAREIARQRAELVESNRKLLAQYDDLAKRVSGKVSAVDRQAFQKLQAEGEEYVCATYNVCGDIASGWRKHYLKPITVGTWHVIVASEGDNAPRSEADHDRDVLQKRFPKLDFDVINTVNVKGGNPRYAIVVASGLDARTADRIVNFVRDLGVEKGAFKTQQKF